MQDLTNKRFLLYNFLGHTDLISYTYAYKIKQILQPSIYIITNKNRTVLYTGVTSDLRRRMREHRDGTGSAFTAKYNCSILIYFEIYPDMRQAIEREKYIKNRSKKWKLDLIGQLNPDLEELEP